MTRDELVRSIITLAIGVLGAALARVLYLPMYMLVGPAIAVAVAGAVGLPIGLSALVRNIIFLLVGIVLGASVNEQASAALLHWPLAFVMMGGLLVLVVWSGRVMLMHGFGFDHKTAVLAAAPGHLSYVLSLGVAQQADLARVSVVQSVRLIVLTFSVPVLAVIFGIDTTVLATAPAQIMTAQSFGIILLISVFAGVALSKANVPAALLLGGMIVSAAAQQTGMVRGAPDPDISLGSLIAIGALIGARFGALRRREVLAGLVAGVATTLLALLLAGLFAAATAWMLDMPMLHVLVAFSPGGLETMLAMGLVLGADPGFVVGCHVARLLILTLLVPAMLVSRTPRSLRGG